MINYQERSQLLSRGKARGAASSYTSKERYANLVFVFFNAIFLLVLFILLPALASTPEQTSLSDKISTTKSTNRTQISTLSYPRISSSPTSIARGAFTSLPN